MTRKLILAGAVPLAVALLMAAPRTVAAAEPASETAKILEELKDLRRSINDRLDQLDRSVKDAQNKTASLDDRLYRLQREALTADDVRQIRSQIDQLQRDFDAVRSQVGSVRESLKTSPTSPSVSQNLTPPSGYGTLRVRNDYLTTMEVIVNGRSYWLTPGVETDIHVPGGSFTYQVIGVDSVPRTRTIIAGRRYPVRIYPVS